MFPTTKISKNPILIASPVTHQTTNQNSPIFTLSVQQRSGFHHVSFPDWLLKASIQLVHVLEVAEWIHWFLNVKGERDTCRLHQEPAPRRRRIPQLLILSHSPLKVFSSIHLPSSLSCSLLYLLCCFSSWCVWLCSALIVDFEMLGTIINGCWLLGFVEVKKIWPWIWVLCFWMWMGFCWIIYDIGFVWLISCSILVCELTGTIYSLYFNTLVI